MPPPRKASGSVAPWIIGWPELLLVAGVLLLVVQLFPSAARAAVELLDVRTWTWRSYAVASSLWIVLFAALNAWRNSRPD